MRIVALGPSPRTSSTITDRYRRATIDTLKLAFASSMALELVATLSVALIAVCVGLRLDAASLDFRTALVVLLLAPEAYWPMRRLGAEFHAAAEGTASLEAAEALFALADPIDLAGPTAHVIPIGDVELDDITLRYGDRTVVEHFSATLRSPGLTAVSGPSGCGKSTLMAALIGELPPSAGQIRIGGVELTGAELGEWRAQLAWAPQRPWLIAGTVAENVRLGRPTATEDDVWRAVERVGLADTLANLGLGLHTPLGEDGAGLSAGQRARVALARVVLSERPYVFLDEPTAHLDRATEAVFLDTVLWLAERSTVVVVAHRQAVLDAADRVVHLPGHVASVPCPGADLASTGPLSARSTQRAAVTSAPPSTAPEDDHPPRFGRRTGIALGALSVASGVALTATAAWLITRASEHPPVLMMTAAIVGVRAFGVARPLLRYAERLVSHDAALRMLAERRTRVYDALVPLVPGRLGVRRGDVLASVVDDVDATVDHDLRVRQPLWTAALVGGGAGLFAWLIAPAAGLVVLGLTAVTALTAALTRKGASVEAQFVRQRARLSTRVEGILHGARQLVMWQASEAALEALDREGMRLAETSRRCVRVPAAGRAVIVVSCGLGVVSVAAVVPPGATTAPMLAMLAILPLALTDALVPAIDAGALAVQTAAAKARLDALEALEPAVQDPPAPRPFRATVVDMEARRVCAGWGEGLALTDVSLDLPAGRRLAVVGPSGSGKSTLAALLLRFLDPRTGTITLGETALADLRLDDVRRTVGLVDDDPYIFSSTVVENIRLARPEALDVHVEQALRAAHLGDWLDGLSGGLATSIGEGSALVSGGERARIGLARTLLADQMVLVLDEPTAHLDTATALAVTTDLLAASKERTIVWITHGTVGLESMDAVLHLSDTAESNDCPDLLAQSGCATSVSP